MSDPKSEDEKCQGPGGQPEKWACLPAPPGAEQMTAAELAAHIKKQVKAITGGCDCKACRMRAAARWN